MAQIYGIATAYKANGNDALALMIPKAVKDKLKLDKGSQFQVEVEKDGTIVFKPNR